MPKDVILIGKKPAMSYVMAMIFQLNQGAKELTVKARGMLISRAVDVVEILQKRFFEEGKLVIKDIQIGTQTVGEAGNERNVSTIEIKIAKQ